MQRHSNLEHLTDCTADERVSLIADLFSDRDEIESLKDLSGGNVQSFIDEALFHSHVRMAGPITLSRRWATWRRGSGGSVWPRVQDMRSPRCDPEFNTDPTLLQSNGISTIPGVVR